LELDSKAIGIMDDILGNTFDVKDFGSAEGALIVISRVSAVEVPL
jgi:hypothetical protein